MAASQQRTPEKDDENVFHLKFLLHLGGDDRAVLCRVRRDTKLQKAIDDLCASRSLDGPTLQFYCKRRLLARSKTPNELGLKSGYEIDVVTNHTGA